MWFKNLRAYQFTGSFELSAEELEERLEDYRFSPCGKHDTARYGWTPPLGRHGQQLTHATNGYIMICAQKQEKILPASVINELVDEKIAEIQENEGRDVFRKEKRDIKDEVLFTVLPHALARTQRHFAFIAPEEGLLLIDSASAANADALLSHLRESVGSLQVVPVVPRRPVVDTMTNWVQSRKLDNNLELGKECDMRDPLDSKNVVRCRQQELGSQEVLGHLDAGKLVIKLGILWNESISASLNEDFSLRQIRFEEIVQEQAQNEDEVDAATQFDNDFAIMSLELTRFFEAVTKACGMDQESAAT